MQKNEKRFNCILIADHCFFYSLIVSSLLSAKLQSAPQTAWGALDTTAKIVPAILLIISVLTLRKLINRLGVGLFVSRERLMSIHTVIFIAYIVSICGVKISNMFSYEFRDSEEYTLQCKATVSLYVFSIIVDVMNMATIVLFAYLSIIFSKPASEKLQKVMNEH